MTGEEHTFRLTGLIHHGVCGQPMAHQQHGWRTYTCRSGCADRSVDAELAEVLAWEQRPVTPAGSGKA